MANALLKIETSKPLSIREESVLSLTCAGLNDKEIAVRLGIGLETVRTYWGRIKDKLSVESRSEAVVAASRRDLSNIVRAHETENQVLLDEIQRRKTAEGLLSESEARFKFFCEVSNEGVFLADPKGRCTYLNPRGLQLLGVNEEDVLGNQWMRLPWNPKSLRKIRNCRIDLSNSGLCRGQFQIEGPANQKSFEVSVRTVHHRQGPAGYIGVIEDRSASLDLQRKIEEAKQFCECVSAATQDIVYVAELATGTLLYVNHASESLFGMSAEQIRNLGPGALAKCIDPSDHAQLAAMQERYASLADGESIRLHCRALAADGSKPRLEGRVVVYKRDELGVPKKMLGVLKILPE